MTNRELKIMLNNLSSAGAAFYDADSAPASRLQGLNTPYYPAESHQTHIEMIMLLRGAAAIQVNGAWFPLEHGQPQIFLMGARHTEHFLSKAQPYSLFWLTAAPDGINLHTTMYSADSGYGQSPTRMRIMPPAAFPLWECGKKIPVYRPRFHYLLMQCLDYSIENDLIDARNYKANAVEQVKKYIDEYYGREISLNDLGRMVHYSPGYLNALFQQAIGMPIYRYLCEVRLRHAAELLRSRTVTVKDAAEAVGIRDQLYFSRYFRRKFGVSPSEYEADSARSG